MEGDSSLYERWTDYLPIIEHEYNSTPQSSTGLSLNELRFAQPVRGISTLLTDDITPSESAKQMTEDLLNRWDEARDAIIIAQEYQKKQSDKKHTPKEYIVGDVAMLK